MVFSAGIALSLLSISDLKGRLFFAVYCPTDSTWMQRKAGSLQKHKGEPTEQLTKEQPDSFIYKMGMYA